MFEEFAARMPGVKLLANMTEFGRTPFFTAAEFEAMGYAMVIWPVSVLRIAAKAMEGLYASIKAEGGTHKKVGEMQTRAELYATIGYHDYEALDASLVKTIIPMVKAHCETTSLLEHGQKLAGGGLGMRSAAACPHSEPGTAQENLQRPP